MKAELPKISKGDWRYSDKWLEVTTSKPGILEGSKKVCEVACFDKTEEEVLANGSSIATIPDMIDFLDEVQSIEDCSSTDEWTWATINRLKVKAAALLLKASGKGVT